MSGMLEGTSWSVRRCHKPGERARSRVARALGLMIRHLTRFARALYRVLRTTGQPVACRRGQLRPYVGECSRTWHLTLPLGATAPQTPAVFRGLPTPQSPLLGRLPHPRPHAKYKIEDRPFGQVSSSESYLATGKL